MKWFSDKERPNHPIVLALYEKGYFDFELNYSRIEFWCIDSYDEQLMQITKGWLGFTIKSSIKNISKFKQKIK